MDFLMGNLNMTMLQMHTVLIVLIVALHFICATAIAKDVGRLHKRMIPTQMMPGMAWILAGLLIGVWGLLIYWLMHHSSLAR